MTKSEYIKMNRGINEQKDLPREYLEAIYDEIATNEIRMKAPGLSAVRVSIGGFCGCNEPGLLCMYIHTLTCAVSEKQRRQAYSQEMAKVAETAKTLMENISEKSSTFTSATHVEHVRGMFKVNKWLQSRCSTYT